MNDIVKEKMKDKRQEARKKSLELDKKLDVSKRVITLRLIRPYDVRIEDDYREFKENLKMKLESVKTKKEKNKLRRKEIKNFFGDKKKQFSDLFTIEEFWQSLLRMLQISRELYNRAVSKSYFQLINNKKIDHYYNVVESIKEVLQIPFYQKFLTNTKEEDMPADFKTGLAKKIQSNFRRKEILKGKTSVPVKKSGTLPFYLSQGGIQKTNSLIGFAKISDQNNSKLDDYILEFKVPIIEDGKILFKKKKFICSTQKRQRNFKRSRDDATNKTILEFLDGTRESTVEEFLQRKIKNEKLKSRLLRKYTQIANYEILTKPMRFSGKEEPYVAITINELPREKSELKNNIIAGIDFCYSKENILSLAIVDLDKFKIERNEVGKWQIFGKNFLDGRVVQGVYKPEYGLRRIYDDFFSELRLWQKRLNKKIDIGDKSHKFVLRFNNRRNYTMKLMVAHLFEILTKNGVSKVYIENLDNLSKKEDWFTINKIRKFPRKTMFNILKQKLEEKQMRFEEVNPKNTSRKCSACGKENDNFNFEYRTKHDFPKFTCVNESCIFGKPIHDVSDYQKYLRDADLNAARNVALRGEKLI